MMTWEYTTTPFESPLSDEALNKLGSTGWELVAVGWRTEPYEVVNGLGTRSTHQSVKAAYIFKKPREAGRRALQGESR